MYARHKRRDRPVSTNQGVLALLAPISGMQQKLVVMAVSIVRFAI